MQALAHILKENFIEWYKNNNIYAHKDSLAVVAKIASAIFYEYDTKMYLSEGGGIEFQERSFYYFPGARGLARKILHSADRSQLEILGPSLIRSALLYQPHKNKAVKHIFQVARQAILSFHRTYYNPDQPTLFQHFFYWIDIIDEACKGPLENYPQDIETEEKTWEDGQIQEIYGRFLEIGNAFAVDLEWQKEYENVLKNKLSKCLLSPNLKEPVNKFVKPIPAQNIASFQRTGKQMDLLKSLEWYLSAHLRT